MKIYYVYDALCGWCYGFSPVIQAFATKHAAEVEIEVVSGCMVKGDRIGPIGEVAPYIAWAYKDVENASGVQFGSNFLDITLKDGKAIFTSLPACLAMSAFKTLRPAEAVAFASRLQKGVYWEGREPMDTAHYGTMAAEFGLNSAAFIAQMQSPATLSLAQVDIALSNSMGVTGFPTVVAEVGGKRIAIARGFVDAKTLEANYQKAAKMLK